MERAPSAASEQLEAWSRGVQHGVVQVADNVHVALGFTHSVNAMIVGPEGLIIIDPGHELESARKVRAAFAEISPKPVRAVIYTHSHIDHTRGTPAFLEGSEGEVQIWARANFDEELNEILASGQRPWVRPAFSQGGDLADDELFIPEGHPRPRLLSAGGTELVVPPTDTFDGERVALTLAGVELELVAAPGETSDQLYVWLPAGRVLFAGDNVSHSWPNVYSLRGVHRDTRAWIASLDRMIEEGPERLVQGHGNPILEGVVEQLQNRRDALQWVFDATVAAINRKLTPDEVVAAIELPERFAKLDYLADYYGSLEACVRQIYADRVGWFSGDPLDLFRDSPRGQSERVASWLGGEAALIEAARRALADGDALGAAQLAQHGVRLRPADPEPKRLMAAALELLAQGSINVQARNYALSYRNQLRKQADAKR